MCPVSCSSFTAVLLVLAAVVQASGQDTDLQVEEYDNNKDWVALKRGLGEVLDHSSTAYKQLQSVDIHNYPLYDVGYKRYTELAELLVTYGGAANVADSYGDTILHGAAATGDLAAVEWLQAHEANVQAQDKDGWTPLMCAAAWGQLEVVKHLVGVGVSTTTRHKDSWTAFDWARRITGDMCPVSRYFTAVLPVLAAVVQASGQDTNVLAESLDRTQNGMCRLDAPNIRRLVEEYNNNKNWVALKRGLTAILDLSSKAYKQLRSVDYSNYPFYDVGYKRYNELAELLVTYGGALNVSDSYGDTILHGAAAAGDLAAVEWLQARGANIEALDKDRWTPLMCAAAWGQLDVVKHLVEAGVSTTTKHKDNWTAYDWARTRRHPAVEVYLAEFPH